MRGFRPLPPTAKPKTAEKEGIKMVCGAEGRRMVLGGCLREKGLPYALPAIFAGRSTLPTSALSSRLPGTTPSSISPSQGLSC